MILSCLSPTSALIRNRILLTTTQKTRVSWEETGWQIKKIGSSIDEIESFRFSFLFSPLTHSSQRRVVLIPRQRKEPVFSTVQRHLFFFRTTKRNRCTVKMVETVPRCFATMVTNASWWSRREAKGMWYTESKAEIRGDGSCTWILWMEATRRMINELLLNRELSYRPAINIVPDKVTNLKEIQYKSHGNSIGDLILAELSLAAETPLITPFSSPLSLPLSPFSSLCSPWPFCPHPFLFLSPARGSFVSY